MKIYVKVKANAKEEKVKEHVAKSNNLPMGHGETVLVVDDEKACRISYGLHSKTENSK